MFTGYKSVKTFWGNIIESIIKGILPKIATLQFSSRLALLVLSFERTSISVKQTAHENL